MDPLEVLILGTQCKPLGIIDLDRLELFQTLHEPRNSRSRRDALVENLNLLTQLVVVTQQSSQKTFGTQEVLLDLRNELLGFIGTGTKGYSGICTRNEFQDETCPIPLVEGGLLYWSAICHPTQIWPTNSKLNVIPNV